VLNNRVSGNGEAELRLLGDVRFPSRLNGSGFLRATDGTVESKLPLAGLRNIPFNPSATWSFKKAWFTWRREFADYVLPFQEVKLTTE
jgi:hypothetical protein